MQLVFASVKLLSGRQARATCRKGVRFWSRRGPGGQLVGQHGEAVLGTFAVGFRVDGLINPRGETRP